MSESTPTRTPTPGSDATPAAQALARRLASKLSYERSRTVLQELLRVPSPQTDLLEAEPQLREFIRTAMIPRMAALGFTRVRQDALGNMIAERGAADAKRSLMLVMHAMNQPANTMPDPYGATIIDGRPHGMPGEAVLGKGASEQKGTLAAVIHAIEAVRDSGVELDGRLVLLCLVSGETGNPLAISHVVEKEGVRADVAYVYGNAMQLQLGNRGRVDVTATVHGSPSHSSRPNEGANAIVGAMEFLRRLAVEIPDTRSHPGLGTAWLTCNGIESFPKSTHTVQGTCVVKLDQRLLPGDDPQAAVARIEAVARSLDDWPDPISGKPFRVPGEKAIEGADIPERPSVGQRACRVHFRAELVLNLPSGLPFFGWLVARPVGAVAFAQTADGIESFQCESGRVDLGMAGGAVGVAAVAV